MEKIFIAPRQMHKNLLSLSRKGDFFVNPKILTREEFLDKYFGRISGEGLYYLFSNKDLIYDNLMQISPYISRSNENCVRNKNVKLFEWKQELIKENLIEKDEFFKQFISGKEFEIYGYSEKDYELLSLLNICGCNYEFKKFSSGNNELSIKNFPLLEDEIFYMLNEIASLLDKGISPEDIYIYTDNENAIFYIKNYYESFGFTVNFPNDRTLYSQESVSEFLAFCKIAQSFEGGFDFMDQFNVKVPDDIRNTLDELTTVDLDFEKKLDYISSCLKARTLQNTRYENAVNIISEPIFDENKYIFIPCFAQNIFPKSYKDNGYISDKDKEELNVLTSLEKCRIEDEISRNFLLSNNKFYLSRSSASFSERYFASPFVELLKIKEEEIKDLPKVIYSKKYGEYRLGIDKDNELSKLNLSEYQTLCEIECAYNNLTSLVLGEKPNLYLEDFYIIH